MRRIETALRVILVPLDALSAFLGFVLAYRIRVNATTLFGAELYEGYMPPLEEFSRFALGAAVTLVIIYALHQLYAISTQPRFVHELPRIMIASVTWLLAIITWFFVQRELFFSRLVLGLGFVLALVFVLVGRGCTRLVRRGLLSKGVGVRSIVIVGDSVHTRRLVSTLMRDKAFRVAGFIDDVWAEGATTAASRLGGLREAESIILAAGATDVLITNEQLPRTRTEEILDFCQENKIGFYLVPEVYGLHQSQIVTTNVLGMPLIELRQTPLAGWGRVWKRVFDVAASAVGIVVLVIPGALLSLLIRADSRGPAIVKLKRVNQGKEFYMYKFRSMVSGAAELKETLMGKNERSGPLFKMQDDPRITRLGKFLRKSRIDEFPQLFNVLVGHMSIVGPRPHEPSEVAKYQKHHRRVLAIKPGMTGLAQVSGASDLDFEEEVKLDTYYIERWSLWMDLGIIFKTIWIVLRGKGAA